MPRVENRPVQGGPGRAVRAGPSCGRGADLALRELLAAAGLTQTHLLPLDFALIARHEAGFGQNRLEGLVVVDQRACDAVAHRAGLTRFAAAVHVDLDVERRQMVGQRERLGGGQPPRFAGGEVVDRAAVDDDVALAALQEHACNRTLAPSGPVIVFTDHPSSLIGKAGRWLALRALIRSATWAAEPSEDARRRCRSSTS